MGRSFIEGARRVVRRVVVGSVVGATLATGIASTGAVAAASTVPSAQPSARGVADVALDVAGLGKLAALKYCATQGFAADPDSVEVLYGVRQLTSPTASSRTFVLRNGSGKVLLCDQLGRDRPSLLPLPGTSASRPAVLFSNGQRRWSCDGTTLRKFRMTSWLKVQDPVRTARVRYSVDGVPGPWFTAARQGRFIHLQSWLASVPGSETIEVELQLLDKAGSPVAVPGIPSGARRLDGCGTSVLIG